MIYEALRDKTRKNAGRYLSPSLGIVRFNWILEIVLRKESTKFEVLPQRWIIERTFAWFESYRRLSKDFEFNIDKSQAMIQLAMIKLMLNRIKK